jgi:hypothetical protein
MSHRRWSQRISAGKSRARARVRGADPAFVATALTLREIQSLIPAGRELVAPIRDRWAAVGPVAVSREGPL